MADLEEVLPQPPDFSKLVPQLWTDEAKGLTKSLIHLSYVTMDKPTDLSGCRVSVKDIQNVGGRQSNYLAAKSTDPFWIHIGYGATPIDCYVELFLKQMLVGEQSECKITTKSGDEIKFTIKLIATVTKGYPFELSIKETLSRARDYKTKGVAMFKDYPVFAQEYFNKAAKLMLSIHPFESVDEAKEEVNVTELEALLENIYLNIAACLLKQQRYEEVVYVLKFADRMDVPDKAVYRRALALYHLRLYDDAKIMLERLDYKGNRDFAQLYAKVIADLKVNNENYASMVKKMFG